MKLQIGFEAIDGKDPGAKQRGRLPFLLSYIARNSDKWPVARLAHVLLNLLVSIPRQLEICKVMQTPAYKGLPRLNPLKPFRYLGDNYLARSFGLATRASCFLHHYRRLGIEIPDKLLSRMMLGNVLLFEMHQGGQSFGVSIGRSTSNLYEGELSLNFLVDGNTVFVLSFTIVPGWAVGSARSDVLLISRIQGSKGSYSQISLAMKAMNNLGIEVLLVTILQGIARVMGISELVSVCSKNQASYSDVSALDFRKAYDDFFAEIGMTRNASGFFSASIPLQEKPLASIKSSNRFRTRKQRALKLQIQENVCRFLLENLRCAEYAPVYERMALVSGNAEVELM